MIHHVLQWIGLWITPALITVIGILFAGGKANYSGSRFYNDVLIKTQLVYPNFYFAFWRVVLIEQKDAVTFIYLVIAVLLSLVFFGLGIIFDRNNDDSLHGRNVIMALTSIIIMLAFVIANPK